jgi:DNA-binding protein HU-beta
MANKKELIDMMAEKSGLTKKDTESALRALTDIITDTLYENDKVSLVGFGTFEVRDVPAKTGVSKLGGLEKPWSTPACK